MHMKAPHGGEGAETGCSETLRIVYGVDMVETLLQAHAATGGSHGDGATARAVARLGAQGGGGARPPKLHKLFERDLHVFVAFQTSAAGKLHQERLTRASRSMAEWVGDCTPLNGWPTASVFQKLSNKVKAPGRWLLRTLLRDGKLADAAGVCTDRATAPRGHAGCFAMQHRQRQRTQTCRPCHAPLRRPS